MNLCEPFVPNVAGVEALTDLGSSCLLSLVCMPKKTFPTFVPPMMAESAKAPFNDPDWIFEIKLDGYRAITVFDSAGKPHLWSRNGLPLEQNFRRSLRQFPN
jgi:ATP-dependent DNA ligase